MKYSVDWTDDAIDSLTTIWLQSADRGAVTTAQVAIDKLLAADPLVKGALVSEGLYALEVHPLRVLFAVDDVASVVTVESVKELS